MIDIVDGKEKLEVVFVDTPAVFRPSVGHDPQHRQVVFLMEWQHPVIEQVGSRDRRLGGVEFSVCHLGIGVHLGLLVDPPDALQCADIKRIL